MRDAVQFGDVEALTGPFRHELPHPEIVRLQSRRATEIRMETRRQVLKPFDGRAAEIGLTSDLVEELGTRRQSTIHAASRRIRFPR